MDMKYKEDELTVRAGEAENRRVELELQKDRQRVELEERKRMTDFMFKMIESKMNDS